MTQKYVPILDAGHGWNTRGKRSPDDRLREYEFNDAVVNMIYCGLHIMGLKSEIIAPGRKDVGLQDRVDIEHQLYKKHNGSTFLVSVHANAHKEEFNDANGVDTFYYTKSKSGKKYAPILQSLLVNRTGLRDRQTEGRPANYWILKYTKSPALLSENGFMTNKKELDLLLDPEYRLKVALAHIDFFQQICIHNV